MKKRMISVSEVRLLLGYLRPEHFDSEVARQVFDESSRKPVASWRPRLDKTLLAGVMRMQDIALMSASVRVDKYLFPALTPAGRRQLCQIFFERIPATLPDLPNSWAHIKSLGAAVGAAENFNAPTLERLRRALS